MSRKRKSNTESRGKPISLDEIKESQLRKKVVSEGGLKHLIVDFKSEHMSEEERLKKMKRTIRDFEKKPIPSDAKQEGF